MGNFLTSVLREFAQKAVGVGVLWLVAHGIDVPKEVTDWAVLAIVVGGVAAWTVVVRFLETRSEDSAIGRAARGLARLLMLGIASKPVYVPPDPAAESRALLRSRMGIN